MDQEFNQILQEHRITTPDQLRRTLLELRQLRGDLARIRDLQADLITELQEAKLDQLALFASTIVTV